MTDIEQRLVKAARDGEWFTCTEPDTVVRAGLIRELLLGRHGELDPAGVRLHGARIEGALDLRRVKATTGLIFSHCTVGEPIEAYLACLPELRFIGGRCAGIRADSARIDGNLFLCEGVRFVSDDAGGTIRLLGVHVAGSVEVSDAEITNTGGGSALNCDRLEVDGSLTIADGVRITGHGRSSSLRLVSADISGQVYLARTDITNVKGIALDATGVHVGGNLFLRDELTITGHDKIGALSLLHAQIGNILTIDGATFTNTAGPALNANRARIGGYLALLGRTLFAAGGDSAAVSLISAQVGGRFGCTDTVELRTAPDSELVLDLQDMKVGAAMRLPRGALCPEQERDSHCGHGRLVHLDDFTWSSLASGWDWEQWLHVIRCHTPAYHASAYQRLAAVERAAGHDGTVRRILMAQQTDLRRRSPQSLGGPLTRWFHWLWGVLAGYGYRARRTAAALLLVLIVAGAIGWWAGQVDTRPGHLVAERVTSATSASGVPCSTVELIGLGLDRGLPLAMTGMRARCDLDSASKKGQAFTAAIWLVQLAVWGLATLALAGYTNLVRKPG